MTVQVGELLHEQLALAVRVPVAVALQCGDHVRDGHVVVAHVQVEARGQLRRHRQNAQVRVGARGLRVLLLDGRTRVDSSEVGLRHLRVGHLEAGTGHSRSDGHWAVQPGQPGLGGPQNAVGRRGRARGGSGGAGGGGGGLGRGAGGVLRDGDGRLLSAHGAVEGQLGALALGLDEEVQGLVVDGVLLCDGLQLRLVGPHATKVDGPPVTGHVTALSADITEGTKGGREGERSVWWAVGQCGRLEWSRRCLSSVRHRRLLCGEVSRGCKLDGRPVVHRVALRGLGLTELRRLLEVLLQRAQPLRLHLLVLCSTHTRPKKGHKTRGERDARSQGEER